MSYSYDALGREVILWGILPYHGPGLSPRLSRFLRRKHRHISKQPYSQRWFSAVRATRPFLRGGGTVWNGALNNTSLPNLL